MCSHSKILSNLCKVKSVIGALVINIAVVGVYMLMILREDAVKHHIILSGLNCPLDAGILSVTTTNIWDSKVVQVKKHDLELFIREKHRQDIILNLEQESPKHDEHCIKVIFLQNEDSTTPQSCFGGSEIIINLSGQQSISSEYPIAQPGFPTRGEFRHGFDIVTPPFLNDPPVGGNLYEQYDALHNKRSEIVSISLM